MFHAAVKDIHLLSFPVLLTGKTKPQKQQNKPQIRPCKLFVHVFVLDII